MASAKQHQLNTLLDRRGPGTFRYEETGTWIESGWQFFGLMWKSDKLKKKIGITIAGNSYNLDVPSSI